MRNRLPSCGKSLLCLDYCSHLARTVQCMSHCRTLHIPMYGQERMLLLSRGAVSEWILLKHQSMGFRNNQRYGPCNFLSFVEGIHSFSRHL